MRNKRITEIIQDLGYFDSNKFDSNKEEVNKINLASLDKLLLTTTDTKNFAPDNIFAIFPTKRWVDNNGVQNVNLEVIQYTRKKIK